MRILTLAAMFVLLLVAPAAATFSGPDGRIAYVSRDGTHVRQYQAAIFTVRQDGSDLRRIIPWGGNVGYPDWSPDGRRLVVTAHWDTRPGASSAVYILRPDGKSW